MAYLRVYSQILVVTTFKDESPTFHVTIKVFLKKKRFGKILPITVSDSIINL